MYANEIIILYYKFIYAHHDIYWFYQKIPVQSTEEKNRLEELFKNMSRKFTDYKMPRNTSSTFLQNKID